LRRTRQSRFRGIIPLDLPPDTVARSLWIGLPGTQTNRAGNHRVGLAEVRIYGVPNLPYGRRRWSGPTREVTNNLASFKPSYMLRLDSSVAPAATRTTTSTPRKPRPPSAPSMATGKSTSAATRALYGVRAIGASGIGSRLTNAIVRLYDGAHESVFARRLTGKPIPLTWICTGPCSRAMSASGSKTSDAPIPVGASSSTSAFARSRFSASHERHRVVSFAASAGRVQTGEEVTLSWAVEDVRRVEILPGLGSVGARTAANGAGSVSLKLTKLHRVHSRGFRTPPACSRGRLACRWTTPR